MRTIKVITKEYSEDVKQLTLYPISDVHLGSMQCMEKAFSDYLKMIGEQDNAAIILAGDLIDNGIKTSKTDIYTELYTPREQKHLMIDYLRPVKDKIICAVRGNHEYRTSREVSIDVMEDICRELGIEDTYAQDAGIIKITLGKDAHNKRVAYSFLVSHGAGGGMLLGSGLNKPNAYQLAVEGVDGIISGHTHKPAKAPSGRIIYDPRNNKVTRAKTLIFVGTAWLDMGGYPEQKLMQPVAFHPDTITLSGERKEWK